ncbi:MAG: Y-family DNA polymerase [Alphaproteobacteria bacterium]|nr:Y-family DNA polymerase [Alphaproteobacteria bacterium]OJV14212.1 MAG: hypothetical protein BGO27_01780 [Alphaproteobacteria bacterium 33-17]
MYALADGNNFYVSCQRIFEPKLHDVPVVILSNNDGCVIARSNEAKAIGVPMGAPIFKYQYLIKKHNVKVFSSNFELYGDISSRMMQLLSELSDNIEIYSIDEMFMDITKERDLAQFAEKTIKTISKQLGMPLSIGIGSTKVLAKIANYHAKKHSKLGYFIIDESNLKQILENLPVDEVWGVGRQLATRLKTIGILTAWQLANANSKVLRKLHNVVLEKLHLELNGTKCFDLNEVSSSKKSIASSRSFSYAVEKLEELEEAVAHYVARATEKLRSQKSLANAMYVVVKTNRFQKDYYKNSKIYNFINPTNDTGFMIKAAKECLKEIYVSGLKYKKAGVVLLDIVGEDEAQVPLFKVDLPNIKLMNVMDNINNEYGKNSIFFASQGIERKWQAKSTMKSPSYTTNWNELPVVK